MFSLGVVILCVSRLCDVVPCCYNLFVRLAAGLLLRGDELHGGGKVQQGRGDEVRLRKVCVYDMLYYVWYVVVTWYHYVYYECMIVHS